MSLEYDGQVYAVCEINDGKVEVVDTGNPVTDHNYELPLVLREKFNTPLTSSTDFVWTDVTISLLLEEYKKRCDKFRNPKIKKKLIWQEIQLQFSKMKFRVTVDALDKKFRNLKTTYMRIKDSQNSSGAAGPVKWKFYNTMCEIFKADNAIATASANPTRRTLVPCSSTVTKDNVSRKEHIQVIKALLELKKSVDMNNELLKESLEVQRSRNQILEQYIDKDTS